MSPAHQFKVSYRKKIYRIIQIPSNKSLEYMAKSIIESYDFYFDHAFGFYSNVMDPYAPEISECYTSFADLDEIYPDEAHGKSVKKTIISNVFTVGKKMCFLFDYGDDWMFTVECEAIQDIKPALRRAQLIKAVGKAPIQYQDYDESA